MNRIPAEGAICKRLTPQSATDIFRIVLAEGRERIAHSRSRGTLALIDGETGSRKRGDGIVHLAQRQPHSRRRDRALHLGDGSAYGHSHLRLARERGGYVSRLAMNADKRRRRVLGLQPIGRERAAFAAGEKAQVIRRMPFEKRVQHTCSGIHIHRRRVSLPGQGCHVIGEHLGRREVGGRPTRPADPRGYRTVFPAQGRRRPEVDEPQLEGALLYLIG